jgi:hypothetical protein
MIPAGLRRAVIRRAGNRCEYCGLAQIAQEATFHIDHIKPTSAGGATTPDNLALACVSCSLRKGPSTRAADPATRRQARIFNPRINQWADHFRWRDVEVVGLTANGRATIVRLQLNPPLALEIREEEKLRHRHPPVRPI